MNDPAAKVRVLYSVPEAMALLNLSRTQIYELIRTSRLVAAKPRPSPAGARRLDYRLCPAIARRTRGQRAWPRGVARAKPASAGTTHVSAGSKSICVALGYGPSAPATGVSCEHREAAGQLRRPPD